MVRIAAPGDDSTLFRSGMRPGSFAAAHGASFRSVYDLADLDHSLFLVAPGQSGHVLSPLARNFVQRWRDGGMVMMPARPDAVAARLTLTPEHPVSEGALPGAAPPPGPRAMPPCWTRG